MAPPPAARAVSGVPHAALAKGRRRRPSQDTDSTCDLTRSLTPPSTLRTEVDDHPTAAAAAAATAEPSVALGKRWAPKSHPSRRRPSFRKSLKKGTDALKRSFTLSNHPYDLSNLSGHPVQVEEENDRQASPDGAADIADIERLVRELEGNAAVCVEAPLEEAPQAQDPPAAHLARPSSSKCLVEGRRGSEVSLDPMSAHSIEDTDHGLDIDNDLDVQASPHEIHNLDSESMLARLGRHPTPRELADVAAVRAREYIHECLFGDDRGGKESVLDKEKWEGIPQYSRGDLVVRRHLGKGSFSDAFEVTAAVAVDRSPVLKEWKASRRLSRSDPIEEATTDFLEEGEQAPSVLGEIRASSCPLSKFPEEGGGNEDDDLGRQLEELFASSHIAEEEEEEGDADRQIDELFKGGNANGKPSDDEEYERFTKLLAKQQSDVGPPQDLAPPAIHEDYEEKPILAKRHSDLGAGPSRPQYLAPNAIQEEIEEKPFLAKRHSDFNASPQDPEFVPARIAGARRPRRRVTVDNDGGNAAASFCAGSRGPHRRQATYAMKCLRPQIRSNAQQFIIGVEDLVHETAMLASLSHPNVIKLHGRAGGGCASSSFRLSDGYFILLDRLTDTLEDRIGRWRASGGGKSKSPGASQLRTAASVADALAYLHSKKIVFRDLKPANVGYDSAGVVKLFDFGFAVGLKADANTGGDEVLFDRCGTPRYMAPEVDLGHGYGLAADVHSYGILLWEICALKKPFAHIKTSEEFHQLVFEEGARPKPGKHWPSVLSETMSGCWCSYPGERPSMEVVKALMEAHAREVLSQERNPRLQSEMRKSWVLRRLTG